MKLLNRILVFLLSVTLTVATAHSTLMAAEPATPPPVSRLNPEQLAKALDAGDVNDAVRQVEVAWKQQFEDYFQGKFTTRLLDIDQIAQSLDRIHRQTGKKPALVYAIPTPKHLELILISPQAAPVHKRITAADRKALTQLAQAFRKEVVNASSVPSDYLPVAQRLYQWVIAPLEPDLQTQKINTLIFCLGAGLRSSPMAALHDGKQFLLEKYSLAIIPAFNLLDRNPAVLSGTKVLAMGASEFKEQAPLPAVPVELSAITDRLWDGETLLNQQFTLANLKSQRAAYPFGIVHLATHAAFSPGSVDKSYIQFWDRQLRLDQLKDLKLQVPIVQLLVLSACRTALGDPQAELGFAGLAVQSGAKAALASLWAVSDAGTLVLMSEFYHHLKQAPIKTEALRQAQLDMLQGRVNLKSSQAVRGLRGSLPVELTEFETTELSHPYYWAGFTLIGNPW